MNKELENQLAAVLEKSLQVAEQTGEFVLEQAPMLLQEFYMWHTTKLILGILLCLALVVLIPIIWYRIRRYYRGEDDEYYDDEPGYIIASVFSGIGGLNAFVFLCINIYELIFILVAPKLYLIEYFIK